MSTPGSLKDIISQVKEQTDIVAVVGRVVVLKKAGSSYRGLCPFHKEKTPSFHVVPSKGIYHCFGCKAGGSVIDFVMQTERLDFIEALKQLAREIGLEVPSATGSRGGTTNEDEDRLRALKSANEFALEWYRSNLADGRAAAATHYMEKRGIHADVVEAFSLGAAPDGWSGLKDAANLKGYSDELLVEAGLCKRHEERGTVYDRLRNRLIFPIRDHLGRVSGFGGRRLSEESDDAKYLNSPETPLYHKGRMLYGLDVAADAIRNAGYAIITEGYMDTLMAHQHGFRQTIASLGTALTLDQARLLKRFTSRVVFLYDGDTAGRNAMLKAGEALLTAGLDTRVILLSDSDDPDSFLQREGADALSNLIHEAHEYFDFALETHGHGVDLRSLTGQAELVERTAPLLNAMVNEVQREGGIARLLSRLGNLPREAVNQIIRRKQREIHSHSSFAPDEEPVREEPALDPHERHALKLMLESYPALEILRAELDFSWLTDPRLDPWILYLLSHDGDAAGLIADAEAAGELPGDPALLPEIMADTQPLGDPAHAARQIAARLKMRHHKRVTRDLIDAVRAHYQNDPGGIPESLLRQIHEESRLAVSVRVPQTEP